MSQVRVCLYTLHMKMLRRLYSPALFQGDFHRTNYFEGWYFKQVTANLGQVWSFIPGIALARERFAFIQIIDGMTGKTRFIRYPLSAFQASGTRFELELGASRFSGSSIDLDIDDPSIRVKGQLEFSGITPYPSRLFSPGIMGWYSFTPRMECRHGVVSMDHGLTGELTIDDRSIDFGGGRGYIEKDWGVSFPQSWIWMQSNNFSSPGTSFMLSVARVPWMGSYFMGFLGFLKRGEDTRYFATYNGAKIAGVRDIGRGDGLHEGVELEIRRKTGRLTIRAESTRRGALKSPVEGRMESYIKESVDAVIQIEYRDGSGASWNDTGRRGGLEIVEKIFAEF
jgi:tocopherol cyclase